jgi:hypothetical protein
LATAVATSSVNPASRASVSAGDDDAPQPPVDADGRAAGRAESYLASGVAPDRAGGACLGVVDPRRLARLDHLRGHIPPAELEQASEGEGRLLARAAPRADDRDHVVLVVPDQEGDIDLQ